MHVGANGAPTAWHNMSASHGAVQVPLVGLAMGAISWAAVGPGPRPRLKQLQRDLASPALHGLVAAAFRAQLAGGRHSLEAVGGQLLRLAFCT